MLNDVLSKCKIWLKNEPKEKKGGEIVDLRKTALKLEEKGIGLKLTNPIRRIDGIMREKRQLCDMKLKSVR